MFVPMSTRRVVDRCVVGALLVLAAARSARALRGPLPSDEWFDGPAPAEAIPA